MDKNQTISVTEVHDGINNIGSQTIYMLGQTTQIIYDYDEHQYIVYDPSMFYNLLYPVQQFIKANRAAMHF